MEKVKKVWNSFKSGIVTWVFAYFVMYLVANHIGAMDEYNAQVLKLVDGMNLFYQIVVAGMTCVVLEIIFVGFLDRVLKSLNKESVKESAKNLILTILVFLVIVQCVSLIKVEEIISEAILSAMMCILILKAIVYLIQQQIDTYRFNKKLKEKIKEESL